MLVSGAALLLVGLNKTSNNAFSSGVLKSVLLRRPKKYTFMLIKLLKAKLTIILRLLMLMAKPVKQARKHYCIPKVVNF